MGNNVDYTLTLKDLLTGKLHEADHAAEKLETTLEGVEKVLGTLGVAFGVFEGLSWIKEGVEEAEKLHQAEAQLANTMQNMGTYSDEAYEKVVLGSEEMAEHLKFGNEEIVALQSQLRLVGNIGENEYERIAIASADMATKFGMSLEEAGNSLAKAINAPELMRRLAMQLKIDPATVERIMDMAKAGHEAQARMELLAIAESKVGGAAKAAFEADPIAQFKKNMEEANEAVGMLALDLLKDLKPTLDSVSKSLRTGIEFLKEHKGQIEGLVMGMIAYKAIIIATQAPVAVLTGLEMALNAAASGGVFGLAAIAIGGYIYWISQLKDKTGETIGVIQHLKDVVNDVKLSFQTMGLGISEIWEGITSRSLDLMKEGVKTFYEGFTSTGGQSETNRVDARIAEQEYLEAIGKGPKTAKPTGIKGAKGEIGEAGKDLTPKATGTKAITINISINKMIETFKISTTNLQESASKVHEAVGNALLQAVNDANITANI
jgi:hypothetical protein